MANGHWRTKSLIVVSKMEKFYAFLKKSTEFISMIVSDLKQKFIKD